MKTFKVTDKLNSLQFDDEIVGTFTKVKYTHDTDDGKMFLLFHKIGSSAWSAQPLYAIGLKSAKDHINGRDLKMFREIEATKQENNEL